MQNKMFDLMTKMYNDVQEIKSDIKSIDNRLVKVEITQEEMKVKIDTIIEVQANHVETNKKDHMEMFEILNGRIDITENVIRHITVVK